MVAVSFEQLGRILCEKGNGDCVAAFGETVCLADANLGQMHNQLGILYKAVGQTEQAREHYEKAIQYFGQSCNHHGSGNVRFNLALMHLQSASQEETPSDQETLLRRARTYAAAALRDFQHYEGRAAADEAKAQQLIELIQQQLP